jgi:hypothetical protein
MVHALQNGVVVQRKGQNPMFAHTAKGEVEIARDGTALLGDGDIFYLLIHQYPCIVRRITGKQHEIDLADEHDEHGEHGEHSDGPWLLKEIVADLFESNDALAHCVSEDFVMSKGIAVLFRDRFGGVEQLRATHTKSGGCTFLKHNGRFIYYLVTKKQYFHKPTYDTVRASLLSMRELAQQQHVDAVSMPRIGCGLDGLTWEKVAAIIESVFSQSGIRITVYNWK